MTYFLSIEHEDILKGLVHGKRVLDIGDPGSPFLVNQFAAGAKKWTMVGRLPPLVCFSMLPRNVVATNAKFNPDDPPVQPSEVDLILFCFPSPTLPHDGFCLKWATLNHLIVFLGAPEGQRTYGSPAFWKMTEWIKMELDSSDEFGRVFVFKKELPRPPASAIKLVRPAQLPGGRRRPVKASVLLPKKGERYRLSPICAWPGKRRGMEPPIVEISGDWNIPSGPAKIIVTGEIFHAYLPDLGNRL
ncbi:MAG: hypothetical protein HY360_13480 [Verrucomicrobia bacterium]|nr:hypothetical protein [Verrucomicrobiota bacterium]